MEPVAAGIDGQMSSIIGQSAAASEYVHERSLLMLAAAASRLGIHVDLSGVAPTRRRFGPDIAVPAGEFCSLARLVFSAPQETLGIELASALPLEAAGVWGAMLRASETFGSMLTRAERYMRLFFRYTRLRVEPRGNEVALTCLHPDPSPFGRREQMIFLTFGWFLVWGRSLASGEVTPAGLTLQWAGPGDRTELERFFGCAIRFGAAEDVMLFNSETLGLKLKSRTPELTGFLDMLVERSIRRMTAGTAIVEQVLDALRDGLPSAASEDFVANKMGMTVRTMRRRLAERNVSFRQLLADCRRERAQSLLLDRGLSVTDVSYALGYAEPANFYRAFRGWTGQSPAKWRYEADRRTGTVPLPIKKPGRGTRLREIHPSLILLNQPV